MYQDAAELWSDDSLSGCFVALEKNQLIPAIDEDGDADIDKDDDRYVDGGPTDTGHWWSRWEQP